MTDATGPAPHRLAGLAAACALLLCVQVGPSVAAPGPRSPNAVAELLQAGAAATPEPVFHRRNRAGARLENPFRFRDDFHFRDDFGFDRRFSFDHGPRPLFRFDRRRTLFGNHRHFDPGLAFGKRKHRFFHFHRTPDHRFPFGDGTVLLFRFGDGFHRFHRHGFEPHFGPALPFGGGGLQLRFDLD